MSQSLSRWKLNSWASCHIRKKYDCTALSLHVTCRWKINFRIATIFHNKKEGRYFANAAYCSRHTRIMSWASTKWIRCKQEIGASGCRTLRLFFNWGVATNWPALGTRMILKMFRKLSFTWLRQTAQGYRVDCEVSQKQNCNICTLRKL